MLAAVVTSTREWAVRFQRSLTVQSHFICNYWAWIRDGRRGSVAETGHAAATKKLEVVFSPQAQLCIDSLGFHSCPVQSFLS